MAPLSARRMQTNNDANLAGYNKTFIALHTRNKRWSNKSPGAVVPRRLKRVHNI